MNRVARRERLSLLVSAGAFLVCAILMAGLLPTDRSPGVIATLLLIGVYALAFHLDFEISTGSAVPTQLVLVPMFFVLPVGTVPLAVAAAIALASAVNGGPTRAPRAANLPSIGRLRVAHGWACARARPRGRGPPPSWITGRCTLERWRGAVRLRLRCAPRFCANGRSFGVPPKLHVRQMGWVYLIDAGLAPVGLAVAFAAVQSPGRTSVSPFRSSGSWLCSRASGACESTASSSCATLTAAPHSCSET